jgi:hypothetical protein
MRDGYKESCFAAAHTATPACDLDNSIINFLCQLTIT